MEYKLEQEKLAFAKADADRAERIRLEEIAIKKRQEENAALDKKLEGVFSQVVEANMISKELNRKIQFIPMGVSTMPDFGDMKTTKRDFKIKVQNDEDKYYYMWSLDKFGDRLEMIKEYLNEFFETGNKPDFSNKEQDAFWDPPEPILIGTSYLNLKNLSYMLENNNDGGAINMLSTTAGKDGISGKLKCGYWPVNYDGSEDLPDELLVEEPEELLGKEIFFRVDIESGQGLPNDTCKDVFVEYIFKHEPEMKYQTPNCPGKNANPKFDYKKQHRIDALSEYHLDYFKDGNVSHIVFNILYFIDRTQNLWIP